MSEPAASAPTFTVRQHVRAAIFGVALGMATLVVSMPISSRISGGVLASSLESHWLRPVIGVLILALPQLVFAPLLAFAAGLVVQAPRWTLVPAQLLLVPLLQVAVTGISGGAEVLFQPRYVAALVAAFGFGIALSGWAYARAGRLLADREQRRRDQVVAGSRLTKIDFEAVKSSQPPAPEAAPQPASSDGQQSKAGQG